MTIRWWLHAFCFLVLGSAAAASERHPMGGADLLRMHKGGLNDATLLDFISAYQVSLQVSEAEFSALAEAGLKPATLQALRDRTLASPPPAPVNAPVGKDGKVPLEAPLPRFFVGYPHDPSSFPAWYYGPFAADSVSASQHPRGHAAQGWGWGGHASAWRVSARWRTGQRF